MPMFFIFIYIFFLLYSVFNIFRTPRRQFHICSQSICSNNVATLVLYLSFSSTSFEWVQTGALATSDPLALCYSFCVFPGGFFGSTVCPIQHPTFRLALWSPDFIPETPETNQVGGHASFCFPVLGFQIHFFICLGKHFSYMCMCSFLYFPLLFPLYILI